MGERLVTSERRTAFSPPYDPLFVVPVHCHQRHTGVEKKVANASGRNMIRPR